jgi:chromosome partitioning protein
VRNIEFKTSIAISLFWKEVTAKKLQELVGREKPEGQHHMKYRPADLRSARYRSAGVDPVEQHSLLHHHFPSLLVTRMTKGGVGKTSVSVNVAAAMAMMGFHVLCIDADPQASMSQMLGVDTSNYDNQVKHIGSFLRRSEKEPDVDLASAIVNIYADGFLDLIPSDITLAETDASLVTAMASHTKAHHFLKRNADFLSRNYDVIIVDTAPGTTPIGLAFTYAAHEAGKVLTVVEPEGSCLRALDSLASNLAEIESVTEVKIGMEIVVNKYHPSLKHVRDSMGFLYSKYGSMLNDSIIPSFSGFSRQMHTADRGAAPLVESEPSSTGAAAMVDVAKTLIRSFNITMPGLPEVEN